MSLPTLHTKRLKLRPLVLADAPTVQRLAGDREVAATTLLIPHPYEEGVAEAWIKTHEANWKAGKCLELAVTAKSEELVGAMALSLNLKHRRGELGYWIGAPYWNRGYASEAAAALISYGFQQLRLNRIEAQTFKGNTASERVLEKLGMKREGIRRQHVLKWGRPEDLVLYAVLASDWSPRERSEDAVHRAQRTHQALGQVSGTATLPRRAKVLSSPLLSTIVEPAQVRKFLSPILLRTLSGPNSLAPGL